MVLEYRGDAGGTRRKESLCSPTWRSLLVALLLAVQLQPNAAGFMACSGSCAQLWELPRVQGGPGFAELNAAAGFNHTDLVVISANTTANLPVAQQIFQARD